MAVRAIDDSHHVARHVKSRLVERKDGKIVGCFPQAFRLREANESPTKRPEEYLSVSWLEFFTGARLDQVREVVRELRRKRTVKDVDVITLGNVQKIKIVGSMRSMKLRVLHEQESSSYSAIRGLKREDAEVLTLLAAEAFLEHFEVATTAMP